MRARGRVLAAGVLVAGLLLCGATPVTAAPPSEWLLGGSGFGHGVGMSQYGAYAQARAGRTAAQILAFYYTGTGLTSVTDSMDLRVNLLSDVSTVDVSADALATGGGDFTVTIGSSSLAGTAGQVIRLTRSGSSVVATRGTSSISGASATVTWEGTRARSGPATVLDVAGPGESVTDEQGHYRFGTVSVLPSSTTGLEAVAVVRLHDEYLDYIAEMPWSWSAAALQAQAMAARTYALGRLRGGVRSDCSCHVFDTTQSQVFGGWPPSSRISFLDEWRAAVDATAPSSTLGRVITYDGALIDALYSSSSGGRTQANEDVYYTAPVPYLRSVSDPWSLDPINPNARWTRTRTQAQLAAAFGLADVVKLDFSDRTVGGGIDVARAWSTDGTTATLDGEDVRRVFTLPSTTVRRSTRRLAGDDRYATAAAVARAVPSGASTVVIANGADAHLVDGLVGGPLAGAVGGPILLTTATALPSATKTELDRRASPLTKAYVLGGTSVISSAVVGELQSRGLTVERLAGADRYRTAAAIAVEVREVVGSDRSVLVASGAQTSLVDALGASGVAASEERPILLTTRDSLPSATVSAVSTVGAANALIVGGTGVVSAAIEDQLRNLGVAVTRAGGADRFETAAAATAALWPFLEIRSDMVLTSGAQANLIDAVAAGALRTGMLLTSPTALPAPTGDLLQRTATLNRVTAVGGTGALSSAALTAAANA